MGATAKGTFFIHTVIGYLLIVCCLSINIKDTGHHDITALSQINPIQFVKENTAKVKLKQESIKFESPNYNFNVSETAEDNTYVGTVKATTSDGTAPIYSLSNVVPAGMFTIEPSKGMIYIQRVGIEELQWYYSFQANATASGSFAIADVLVNITGVPLRCFYCSDEESAFNYDPECGLYGYDGVSDESHSHHSCFVTVWNDGSKVIRAMTSAHQHNGFCDDLGDRMTCYCTTNDCNYDLCDHCFPTTTTTMHPTQPTLPPTTGPPASTTGPPVSTTTPPGSGLECYACVGCQTVAEDTSTALSQDYQSCFTSIIAESAARDHLVIRGGDEVAHVDGDCRHEDGAFICYCSTNLCNGDPAK